VATPAKALAARSATSGPSDGKGPIGGEPRASSEPATGPEPDHRDSDEDLLRRIGSGDQAALGDLYGRYSGLVYSVTRHILKDAGAVEEVLQDTFLHLWHIAASFDSARGTLGCWLAVMARHRSIDRLRQTHAEGEEFPATLLGPVLDVESFAASNEKAGRIRAALRALPEAQRVAMELVYFEGLTQSEVAKRTGVPLGTVKTRLRTALASLKRILGNHAHR
jgi:RNA polymerase sigma-70 factor (ECF subfamily)